MNRHWSYVNSKRKIKSGVSELHTERDGITINASDDGKNAEILAEFFSSVFTTDNDETLLENIQYDEYSNNDNFTVTEVNKLSNELNTTKSPGPDQVQPKVLYELSDIIDKPLCAIFNSYLRQGQYPKKGELAKLQHSSRKKVRTLHPITDRLVLLATYVSYWQS